MDPSERYDRQIRYGTGYCDKFWGFRVFSDSGCGSGFGVRLDRVGWKVRMSV